jgi:hypothetical protein
MSPRFNDARAVMIGEIMPDCGSEFENSENGFGAQEYLYLYQYTYEIYSTSED